ncbi:MAG: DUF1631 family protein [Rubrivivax sp.]
MATDASATTAARQQFIEDELLRVPLVADQVLDTTWAALHAALHALPGHERSAAEALLQAVPAQRGRMVERFAASVREQVRDPAGGASAAVASRLAIALLDEQEVAADVEISRLIETVRSFAEHELRELDTCADALVGDRDLSRDHNPFRPEVYARALWQGAQVLPLARGHQLLLLRHAARPLAQVLRQVYASSRSRLEASGVLPAPHRPRIGAGASLSLPPGANHRGQAARGDDAPPPAGLDRSAAGAAHAVAELLGELFDCLLADPLLARELREALARLQPAALRVVLREELALEDEAHPLWRFMDEAAHRVGMHAAGSPGRAALLCHLDRLIDAITRQPRPDAATFRAALGALADDDLRQLEHRVHEAADDIAALHMMEEQLHETELAVPTGLGPLDIGQLDTVPASLLDALAAQAAPGDGPIAQAFVDRCSPGDWVHLFCRGRWISAQLLWQSPRGDAWLFGRDQGPSTLAVRRRALDRLRAVGLLGPLPVRSLVRAAATRLMRDAGARH